MTKGLIIVGVVLVVLVVGLFVFHKIYFALYCRNKNVPGKSHCGVCGHRKTCQKWHNKQP